MAFADELPFSVDADRSDEMKTVCACAEAHACLIQRPLSYKI